MSLWPTVSKKHPCPICGKPDWCAVGDRAIKCMRVSSEHPSKDGGWYHFTDNAPKLRPPPPVRKRAVSPTCAAPAFRMEVWRAATTSGQYVSLAATLGVSLDSVESLGAAWATSFDAWAFPMRDSSANIIGIRLRSCDGKKWAVTGSQSGIFIPTALPETEDWTVFVCEGPTDLMALLSMGFWGIGKPSCNSGNDQVIAALKKYGARRVVIVGDNDTEKVRPDGEKFDPGRQGANGLKKALSCPSFIWYPPGGKDVRQFLRQNGLEKSRALLHMAVNSAVWTRKL